MFILIKYELCLVESYIQSIEVKSIVHGLKLLFLLKPKYMQLLPLITWRIKLLLDNKYIKVFPFKRTDDNLSHLLYGVQGLLLFR